MSQCLGPTSEGVSLRVSWLLEFITYLILITSLITETIYLD